MDDKNRLSYSIMENDESYGEFAVSYISPPSVVSTILEVPRTVGAFGVFWPHFLGRSDFQGDGSKSPVVLIPGFGVPTSAMWGMSRCFNSVGHPTYTPDILLNDGSRRVLTASAGAVARASENTGKPAIIVGHSFGGAVGLLLAFREARDIASVHTLGSPLATAMGRGGANRILKGVHDALCFFEKWGNGRRELEECMRVGPPSVPVVAYRSRMDGVVAWDAAGHPWDGHTIEVTGSHCGLIFSREVVGQILYANSFLNAGDHESARDAMKTTRLTKVRKRKPVKQSSEPLPVPGLSAA